MSEKVRPVGRFKTTETGKSHIPSIIRRELGLEGAGEIPFYLDANCVLLIRSGSSLEDVLNGLDVLKADLRLRVEPEE